MQLIQIASCLLRHTLATTARGNGLHALIAQPGQPEPECAFPCSVDALDGGATPVGLQNLQSAATAPVQGQGIPCKFPVVGPPSARGLTPEKRSSFKDGFIA